MTGDDRAEARMRCGSLPHWPLLSVVHQGFIKREERYLDRKFNDTYRQYRTAVRRWL